MNREQEYPAASRPDTFEARPGRLVRAGAGLAGLALALSLSACDNEPSPRPEGDRNAPISAPYSLDANPQFYADVKAARGYVTPNKAESLDRLSRQAVAEWLPENQDDAVSAVKAALIKSSADGTVPLFVSYAIPNRDLGGHSAGGLAEETYEKYVTAVSRAIGQENAVMVVEPDALAQIPGMTDGEKTERVRLLAAAMDAFADNAKTAVYLDAGNSRWRGADETAGLLKDIASESRHGIPGIALNVSNYQPEDATRTYADEIMHAYGRDLYVLIDNSRNGNPKTLESGDWCNPEVQTLGSADADFDANTRFESAYIKTPGESDGVCGVSGKPAGEFDGDLLLRQLRG